MDTPRTPEGHAAHEPSPAEPSFEWAIVEIYGHRRHAGRVREEERFGAKFLRIDVPALALPETGAQPDARPEPVLIGWTNHSYGGAAIFSLTPTDEATVMRMNRPYAPPARFSLPAPTEDDEGREAF